MSSRMNRLRCLTPTSLGRSVASDSAKIAATFSSLPGLILATMTPRLTMGVLLLLSRPFVGLTAGREARHVTRVHVATSNGNSLVGSVEVSSPGSLSHVYTLDGRPE